MIQQETLFHLERIRKQLSSIAFVDITIIVLSSGYNGSSRRRLMGKRCSPPPPRQNVCLFVACHRFLIPNEKCDNLFGMQHDLTGFVPTNYSTPLKPL